MTSTDQKRVGPWTLLEKLGRGGNATVWRAVADEGSPVALKIVNSVRVGKEPYKRFVREIGFLQAHGSTKGVLPLLDSYLPQEPSKRDPAWLAMPIATPIDEALDGKPLPIVVEAVAAIAATLNRLDQEAGIAHRDIKPGNLYELDGQWLIGDFGLVAWPDLSTLTVEDRPMGPLHFTPYEMIRNPKAADPHRADVFSLGKTLWVLATGQRYPPQGHQATGPGDPFSIEKLRPHEHAAVLDREIDLMTQRVPERRPSKTQVAEDLEAWAKLGSSSAFDLSAAREAIVTKIGTREAEQDQEEEHKRLARAAVRELHELTAPINEQLRVVSPKAVIDSMSDKGTRNTLKSHSARTRVLFRWQRCTIVDPWNQPASLALKMGRSLELFDDGRLELRLRLTVGTKGVMGRNFVWQWRPEEVPPVGTAAASQMLQQGVEELKSEIPQALETLIEELPST